MNDGMDNIRKEDCENIVSQNDGNEGTNRLTFGEVIAVIAVFTLMVVGIISIFYIPHLHQQIKEEKLTNLELQERLMCSEIIEAFDGYVGEVNVSKGMSMDELLDLETQYLACYHVTNIEKYSEEVDRERRVVNKLRNAYENEKDAKNKEVINKSLEGHELLLENSQKELEKWRGRLNDYNESFKELEEGLSEAAESEI